jgi:predicted transcriptional regulator
MATISLRLPDDFLHEVDANADDLHIARTAYVRQALERMNAAVAAERRRKKLMAASLKVREESMKVNAEFSEVDDVPPL